MNKIARGNYYRKKTADWFKKEGYDVEIIEKNQRIWTPKGVIFIKRDLWGADLCAKNEEEIIFIQCKTNRVDINKGIAELNETRWPQTVKKVVVIWELRAREPEIIDA